MSRRKIIVSKWIKKHFKEETLYYYMLFISLSCDIWLTPCAVANSDHYFSISHALALLSAILNKFISQLWNKSILKVDSKLHFHFFTDLSIFIIYEVILIWNLVIFSQILSVPLFFGLSVYILFCHSHFQKLDYENIDADLITTTSNIEKKWIEERKLFYRKIRFYLKTFLPIKEVVSKQK